MISKDNLTLRNSIETLITAIQEVCKEMFEID